MRQLNSEIFTASTGNLNAVVDNEFLNYLKNRKKVIFFISFDH